MNDISIYFSPVDVTAEWHEDQIGSKIVTNHSSFPEIQKNSCALIYVPEFRGFKKSENKKAGFAQQRTFSCKMENRSRDERARIPENKARFNL